MPERFRVSKSEDPNIIFGKYSGSHISEDEDRATEKLLPSNNVVLKKTSGQENRPIDRMNGVGIRLVRRSYEDEEGTEIPYPATLHLVVL
ncbi:hypothetical protein BDFB_001266 [Asbolus verrucosus]|uniref:Uncharacterized protein n=1 Tax=Asbolus verrucosus TaxID=1661398 RepID=A0A482WCI3_ASBVE|nr:hypothetical protein BDFB_001266 [Asbolus verrucosus]